jgi:uncharacterized protein YyaL (SSP411 family)
VLRTVADAFRGQPDRIAHNTKIVRDTLGKEKRKEEGALTADLLDNLPPQIINFVDQTDGGLRGAPKFPNTPIFEVLWRAGARLGKTPYRDLVRLTLTRMSQGGIYDHLGGGFARYSVDDHWLVPHFEKMLYDNAQLLEMLALCYRDYGDAILKTRAGEIVGWLKREMITGGGAFSASLDADSEGEEGKFYVWSLAEIQRHLSPDDARHFAKVYDVTAGGNFEGHTILNRLDHIGVGIEEDKQLAPMRERLLAARGARVRPGLDDKVLADWNGLMIAALVHAACVFERPDWLALARTAFHRIVASMTSPQDDTRLGHSWRAGRLVVPGLASDYAAMSRAALALNEATGERDYLDHAVRWQHALETHYLDAETGSYFLTADDAEGLIVRPHSTIDDAIPNHCGVIAQNLVRLSRLAGDARWSERRDALFAALLPRAAENMFGHLSLLNALDLHLTGAEIVVTGDDATAQALLAAARTLPHATTIVLHAPTPAALAVDHPARTMIDATAGQAAAFLCRGQTCSRPVTDPAALTELARGQSS